MKKLFLLLSIMGILLLFITEAPADVVGTGIIDWTYASDPSSNTFTHTNDDPFGHINYWQISPYAPQPYHVLYFDSDYDSTGSVGDSTVSAQRLPSDPNSPTQHAEGSFLAKTTDSNIGAKAGYGFGEYLLWYNQTLPLLTLDYDFNGGTDSALDSISFTMQVRIAVYAWYNTSGTGFVDEEHIIYSDYDIDPSNGEMIYYEASGADQIIDQDGTKTFGDYDALNYLSDQPWDTIRWFVEYDFGGYGTDYFSGQGPEPPPIPEPTTMLLLGSGILGLAGFRRKFRKR